MTVGLLPAPTDEQEMLLDATTRFIEAELPRAAVRELAGAGDATAGDAAAAAGAGYRRGAAALGWFGMLAAEAHGGGSASGNGLLDAAMIAAERGAALQPGPFAGHNAVVYALSSAGPGARGDVLAALVEGREWATWVPDGPWAGDGAPRLAVRRAAGGGHTLDGTVAPVAEAGDCAWLLVTAEGDDGPTQFLVPAAGPGVTRRRLDGLDVTRRWDAVEFTACPVPAEAVVGIPGSTTVRLADDQLAVAAVLSVAEAVGAMDANIALAVDYAKVRIAFGRPIGSFQAVKHLLAETSLWLEMAKGIVVAAADAVGRGLPDGPALAHVAKSFVGERSVAATHNCFQVFGGIGYTWEHDQHLFMRRLAADAVAFGAPAWHRRRLMEREGL